MTEISSKTIHNKETKFPPKNSPPSPPFTDTTQADTTNNSTDTLETTILAQTQTTSAFCHWAKKATLPQTSGTRKLPNFQSQIHHLQTAKLQLQTAVTHFIFSQSLRKLTNCIPSLKATTTNFFSRVRRITPHPSIGRHPDPNTFPLQQASFSINIHKRKFFTFTFTLQQHRQRLQLSLRGF